MNWSALRVDTRMFSSQVARRSFMTFIACALVPVCALAILAFQQVTSQLQDQSQRRLQQASKQVAMVLLNRLLTAEAALGQTVQPGAVSAKSVQRPLSAEVLVGDGGAEYALIGKMTPPTLTASQTANLAAGKTVLSVDRDGTGSIRVVVSRAIDPVQPGRRVAHGLVDPAFLWMFDDDLASNEQLIIFDEAGQVLISSFNPSQTLPVSLTRGAGEGVAGHFEWRDDRGEYIATHWALFLQATMSVPKWTIVLSQPKADVFAPVTVFKRIFVLVVVLTLLTVVLLSGQQIRRSLTPLAQLQEGARRLALGDLGTRVQVTSHDEFAHVANAFNDMATQLSRQFHTLALRREITAALDPTEPLEHFLQVSADALIRHLELPFVGIWLVGTSDGVLELRASAWSSGFALQPPVRMPLTEQEVERIRINQQPFVTNALLEDPRRHDLAWATGAGFTACLAHPLIVAGRVVGIAGAVARRPFEATELSAFGLAAGDIAGGIDRKRVDDALRESELQTRQLQKMEAVGRLAGGIAHDFNNLLTVISGRTYLLLHDLPADDPHRKSIQTIDGTAQRAAQLTRQLLAFSRKQVLAPTVIDLNEVIGDLTDMLHRLIGEAIELTVSPAAELGKSKLDRGQVEQVLVNLVVNARDAMPEGGRITVETMNVYVDEAFVRQDGGGTPGAHVMIAVTDTGTGMDEATRARIFEPFFTTKEVGKGTGLGLATVLGIVQQSGGHIRVESAVGEGTTFRIYFPRVEDGATPPDTVAGPPSGGRETILIVDDEVEVHTLLQTALARYGYTVLGAASPSEAVRLADSHAGPIHVLLTDMVMPEMSGAVLAQQLATIRPDMGLIYMSGYADYTAEALEGNHVRFLQKPFTPDAALRAVRDVLDSAKPAANTQALKTQPLRVWSGQSPTAQFT